MSKTDKPDFLVVGAGVAGCVAARTLADSGAAVTLLEAGPAELPASLRTLDWVGVADDSPWLWPSTPATDQDRASVHGQNSYLRGRGLGGGSAINGMVADVDAPEFYDSWPEGWHYRELAPHINGVLSVMGLWQPATGKLSAAIGQTDAGAAIEALSLFGAADGVRRTFADAYLAGIEQRRLIVRSETMVQRVLFDSIGPQSRAIGVELASGEVLNGGRVVLCAGTFGTAALLSASEIAVGLREPQDHRSQAVTLELTDQYQTSEPEHSPLSAKMTGDGYEVLVLDHTQSRAQGALMVGETSAGGLEVGVAHMAKLVAELQTGGVATRTFESPGGYFHAASTLPGGSGVDSSGAVAGWSRLNIMDASVMPSLVRCSPSLTIAAVAAMLATNLVNTN